MMSGEDEMTPEEKRASIVEEIISAPTEAVEKIYDRWVIHWPSPQGVH